MEEHGGIRTIAPSDNIPGREDVRGAVIRIHGRAEARTEGGKRVCVADVIVGPLGAGAGLPGGVDLVDPATIRLRGAGVPNRHVVDVGIGEDATAARVGYVYAP